MLDIDRIETEAACPRCDFYYGFTFQQVRLRDVIICRGCHSNIRLDDHLNTFRKARASIDRSMRELEESLRSFGGILKLEV